MSSFGAEWPLPNTTSGSNAGAGLSEVPVLVTGSAGHVGANLVRRLLDDGVRVRVYLRHEDNNEAVEGLEVERSFGDIRDPDARRKALEGCRGVYHCAAMVSTIEGTHAHRRELYECNVLGTRNVLQAAREVEAGRVVVTGSLSAVGYDLDDPSAPSDETMQFYPMERAGEKYIFSSEFKTPVVRAFQKVTVRKWREHLERTAQNGAANG